VSAVVAQCQGAVETAHDVFNHDAPVVFCLLSQQGVAINISVDKQVIALLIGNALSDYILNGVNLLVQSFYHKLECTSDKLVIETIHIFRAIHIKQLPCSLGEVTPPCCSSFWHSSVVFRKALGSATPTNLPRWPSHSRT
jgi:hypothetical protein